MLKLSEVRLSGKFKTQPFYRNATLNKLMVCVFDERQNR